MPLTTICTDKTDMTSRESEASILPLGEFDEILPGDIIPRGNISYANMFYIPKHSWIPRRNRQKILQAKQFLVLTLLTALFKFSRAVFTHGFRASSNTPLAWPGLVMWYKSWFSWLDNLRPRYYQTNLGMPRRLWIFLVTRPYFQPQRKWLTRQKYWYRNWSMK